MLVKVAQLFLSLTILISLHEFGHFWFAKRFKCRVDKFYLFFDFLFPFASVLNFALWKKKIGDTEYGIGWFPLGGYVQIAGMVDEQMDKNLINTPPQPWELRSKPAWQRLLVMLGGILVNLFLGILIFWMVLFTWGKPSIPSANLPHGLMVDSAAYSIGLRNGDYITSLDGKPVRSISRIAIEVIMNGVNRIEGHHADGTVFSLPVDNTDRAYILRLYKKTGFVKPRFIPLVDKVDSTSFAANARLMHDDQIIAVNDHPVLYFDELTAELAKNRLGRVGLTILRGKDTVQTSSRVSELGTIGFFPRMKDDIEVNQEKFGLFSSLVQGLKDGAELLLMQVKQIAVLFTVKDAHKQVAGFYSMVQQMNETWNWQQFWTFTGFLSLALAFMNFLPIPLLDGGYIMFIIWEMITGRKVPDKVIYYANNVGLFIVMGLMIYANTDWLRE
jgi:regulator of sigma E protease